MKHLLPLFWTYLFKIPSNVSGESFCSNWSSHFSILYHIWLWKSTKLAAENLLPFFKGVWNFRDYKHFSGGRAHSCRRSLSTLTALWQGAVVVHYCQSIPLRHSELRSSAGPSSQIPAQPSCFSWGKGLTLRDRSLHTNVKPKCFPLNNASNREKGF